jgi:uncharacterized protein (DUF2062 family)
MQARYHGGMPRKYIRKLMPSADKVREIRVLGLFGETLFHPALWHLHRRSAAGGVAIGLFCGLIPGPLQMLAAAIACVVFRVNLAVALVTTLYTNPITIVPLYLIGYQIGSLATGAGLGHPPTPPPAWDWSAIGASFEALGTWMLSLGTPLALGVFLLACILSALGYFVVRAGWSVYLRRAWLRRQRRRSLSARH